MRSATFTLGAVLLLGGCGHSPATTASRPAATVDPEIGSLRAQLAQARAERDAALARLHALERRKPSIVRVVVREPATAAPRLVNRNGQSSAQVFSTLTTTATP